MPDNTIIPTVMLPMAHTPETEEQAVLSDLGSKDSYSINMIKTNKTGPMSLHHGEPIKTTAKTCSG